MSSATSYWAAEYGMADPNRIAAEIQEADSGTVAASRAALQSAMLGVRFAGSDVRRAVGHVRRGWSTTDATAALTRILAAGADLDHRCALASAACDDLNDAITAAIAEARRAREVADSALVALAARTAGTLPGPDAALHMERERQAIIDILHAALQGISERLDSAAATIQPRLDLDLRRVVPSDRSAAAAPTPAAARHAALTAALSHDLRTATGQRRHVAEGVQRALDQARADGQRVQLMEYDPDSPAGQGSVALAIGDLAHASSVSLIVPGVGNSPSTVAKSLGIAETLNGAVDGITGTAGGSASVLWLGYDIPLSWPNDGTDADTARELAGDVLNDSVTAIDATGAMLGGIALNRFIGTLRPMMDGVASLSLVTHSMGSTTASEAAARTSRKGRVDNVVLLGSPGAGYHVHTADDYRAVDPDHVYSLSFPGDPVPAIGRSEMVASLNPVGQIARRLTFGAGTMPFGPDPTAPEFGAQVIDAPSNRPVAGGLDLDQHSFANYLSGESLSAIAAVVAGRYSQVPVQPPG